MRSIILTIFIFIISNVQAAKWDEWTNVYDDGSTSVEIRFKLYKNGCNDQKTNKYAFRVIGEKKDIEEFVKIEFKYLNCEGNLVIQVESVKIGGIDVAIGDLVESMDYIFMGTLITNFKKNRIEEYIVTIEHLVNNGKFNFAIAEIDNLASFSDSTLLIESQKTNVYRKANDYYRSQLPSDKSINIYSLKQGISVCDKASAFLVNTEFADFFIDKRKTYENQIRNLEYQNVKDKIKKYITTNNYKEAIRIYKSNSSKYDLNEEYVEIEEKGKAWAKICTDNENLYEAISLYQTLYNLFKKEEYLENVQKISEVYYKELCKEARKKDNINDWEKVYEYYQSNRTVLPDYNEAKHELYKLWNKQFDDLLKTAEEFKMEDNIIDYQSKLISLEAKMHTYEKKNYSINIDYLKSRVKKKLTEVEQLFIDEGIYRIKKAEYKFQYKKYKRKTFRVGISYNALNASQKYFGNLNNDLNILYDHFLDYCSRTNASFFNFNMFYGRFGLHLGDINLNNKQNQFQAGLYYNFYSNLYFRLSYVNCSNPSNYKIYLYDENNYPSMVSDMTLPLSIGLSFISPLEIEAGYNLYSKTFTLSLGLGYWKRHSDYQSAKQKYKSY